MALPKVGSHLLAPMHLIFLSILLFLDLKDIMLLRTSAPKHTPPLHLQLFTIKQFLIMPLFESEKDKASDCSVLDENKINTIFQPILTYNAIDVLILQVKSCFPQEKNFN